MLWLEVVAAALVGLALVVLVVAPLVERGSVAPGSDAEPEDLEETPQGVALTALKEIEFDRATGKLSDADYASLKQKYTAEAVAAFRVADGVGDAPSIGVADLDGIIARRAMALRNAATLGAPSCPQCGPRPEGDAVFCSSCGRSLAKT